MAIPTRAAPGPSPHDTSHESHGRHLTTTPEAAASYRAAQAECRDRALLVAALRSAVRADPGFVVAASDLSALAAEPEPIASAQVPVTSRLLAWERHHVEVVTAALRRDARRAVDLLREHLSVVSCDPVATAVVVDAAPGEALDDILAGLPACHGRPVG